MTNASNRFFANPHGNEFDLFVPHEGCQLPAATFTLRQDPQRGLYLALARDMAVPKRLYGKPHHERIFASWQRRASQGLPTGVWLDGEKGSGKTLLAAVLSQKMREAGHPTVLIQAQLSGPAFNVFVAHLGKALILFDEFEKVYDQQEHQDSLLTVFDGAVVAQHLYCLTSNDRSTVAAAMSNRPGRMRYLLEYDGLPTDVAAEYVAERLQDQSKAKELLECLSEVPSCNFDILQAAVDEHNWLGGDIREMLAIMNITREGLSDWNLVFTGTKRKDSERIAGKGSYRGDLSSLVRDRNRDGDYVSFDFLVRPSGGEPPFEERAYLAPTSERQPDGDLLFKTSPASPLQGTVRAARQRGFHGTQKAF